MNISIEIFGIFQFLQFSAFWFFLLFLLLLISWHQRRKHSITLAIRSKINKPEIACFSDLEKYIFFFFWLPFLSQLLWARAKGYFIWRIFFYWFLRPWNHMYIISYNNYTEMFIFSCPLLCHSLIICFEISLCYGLRVISHIYHTAEEYCIYLFWKLDRWVFQRQVCTTHFFITGK